MLDVQICRRKISKQYGSNHRRWFPRKTRSGGRGNYQTPDLGYSRAGAIPQVDGLTLLQKRCCRHFCLRRYLVRFFLEWIFSIPFLASKVFETSQNGSQKRTSIFCTQMFRDYLSARKTIWKAKKWSDSVPKDLPMLTFYPYSRFLQRFGTFCYALGIKPNISLTSYNKKRLLYKRTTPWGHFCFINIFRANHLKAR